MDYFGEEGVFVCWLLKTASALSSLATDDNVTLLCMDALMVKLLNCPRACCKMLRVIFWPGIKHFGSSLHTDDLGGGSQNPWFVKFKKDAKIGVKISCKGLGVLSNEE